MLPCLANNDGDVHVSGPEGCYQLCRRSFGNLYGDLGK